MLGGIFQLRNFTVERDYLFLQIVASLFQHVILALKIVHAINRPQVFFLHFFKSAT